MSEIQGVLKFPHKNGIRLKSTIEHYLLDTSKTSTKKGIIPMGATEDILRKA